MASQVETSSTEPNRTDWCLDIVAIAGGFEPTLVCHHEYEIILDCFVHKLGTPRKLGQDLGKQVVSVNCNFALTVNQFKCGRPRCSVVQISDQNVRLTSGAIVVVVGCWHHAH